MARVTREAAALRLRRALLGTVLVASGPTTGTARRPARPTTLVILGVDHSAQLGAPRYHAGYFRAFFDRVHPRAICIERPPEEAARNDYYEFTYEVQHLAVPYARAHHVALCPIDWLPSRDDERLAFGRTEVVDPPAVRPASGFQGFFTLDSTQLGRTVFYADSAPAHAETRAFFDAPRAPGWRDFPRRLDLYRTFMQAMRIRAATRAYPGDTVLVVVGSMHKDDLERILGDDPLIHLVQPSAFPAPAAAEAAADLEPADLAAILSFNLLGVQPLHGPVDWPWVRTVLDRLTAAAPALPELPLLRERQAVLTARVAPAAAAAAYERIAAATDTAARFLFTGAEDPRRLDSYFDPFGNLGVRDRALVEAARAWHEAGRAERVEYIRQELAAHALRTDLARAEFAVYWERYIAACRRASRETGAAPMASRSTALGPKAACGARATLIEAVLPARAR